MKEPINILLVDDQPAKLLSYEAILADLGENLIKASSGREALEHLLKKEVPVVLMDVSMPELDGFALAEIIRQHPRFRKTAIIFVSAVYLSDIDRIKAYESGAVDYLSVPVVPELLRAKVTVFTELYRKTRDVERLNQELESRVIARTAELESAVHQHMQLAELLRDADRRKDEFLALLAHELRNPLAPVVNAVNIMRQKEVDDPDLKWCASVIERQVGQLTRLVDDLLDVSRIRLGKFKLRTGRLDLGAAITAAVEISRPLIDEHRHTLRVTMPDDGLLVDGDSARLTQALANLLNNAAKFQDDGGEILLRVEREGDSAVITVSDKGAGIPASLQPHIFDLFVQGEHQASRLSGGLGVGLSLVKNVVEMHGGSVAARSAGPGHGSDFVVRLPLLLAQEQPGRPPQASPGARASRRTWRVLVVDDNVDAAQGLGMLLSMAGHQVRLAYNGATALEIVAAEHPEVLLVDIGMPGMDGYEVCRRVRELGHGDAIIAVSGYGQERDRERSAQAGFDAHTVKPVDFDELMRVLERLDSRRARAAG